MCCSEDNKVELIRTQAQGLRKPLSVTEIGLSEAFKLIQTFPSYPDGSHYTKP